MGSNHEEKAVEYYSNNFNCSQRVFTTYAVEHGIDEELVLRIATHFGGGARKDEMCGAVSGALMVLGLLYGHSESSDTETKAKAYAMAEEYMIRFADSRESILATKFEAAARLNAIPPVAELIGRTAHIAGWLL